MSSIIRTTILGLLLAIVAPATGSEVAKPSPNQSQPSPAPAPGPDVQACLDKINIRKAGTTSGKRLPTMFHPLQDPANSLPIQCPNGKLDEIKSALQNQIANCNGKSKQDLAATFQFGCRMVTKKDYCLNTNNKLLKIANEPGMDYASFMQRASQGFDWYESDGRRYEQGTKKIPAGMTEMTGYFNADAKDASMDASDHPTDDYKYPIYSAPAGLTHLDNPGPGPTEGCGVDPDTKTFFPWCIKNSDGTYSALPSREQAAKGALDGMRTKDGKPLQVAWFKDLYSIESIMLEGSGQVNLRQADGSSKPTIMNFAGQNGWVNNMLGTVQACEHKKIPGKQQADYYAAHPDEAYTDTVHFNPSLVFFKNTGDQYEGVDGISVTPNASIATDPTSIPTGAVTLFNVKGAANSCGGKSSTMAVAQDGGGAIRGAHIDRYTGVGSDAKDRAGVMDDPGRIFMAVPKGAGTPVPHCNYDPEGGL